MASNQIEKSLDREIKLSQFLNSLLSYSRAILPYEFRRFHAEINYFEALLYIRSRDHRAVILSNISILQPARTTAAKSKFLRVPILSDSPTTAIRFAIATI